MEPSINIPSNIPKVRQIDDSTPSNPAKNKSIIVPKEKISSEKAFTIASEALKIKKATVPTAIYKVPLGSLKELLTEEQLAAIAKTPFPESLNDVSLVDKSLGGTTGARLAESNDSQYVMKQGTTSGHLLSEYHANKAYRKLGVPVPKVKLYNKVDSAKIAKNERSEHAVSEKDSQPVMLSQFIEGQTLKDFLNDFSIDQESKDKVIQKLQSHFILDCLLCNWDVIGLQKDNIIVTKDGTPYRVDNGSAFEYRAQGQKKHNGFSEIMEEHNSMRSGINPSAASIFGTISDEELIRQIVDAEKDQEKILAAIPEKYRNAMKERIASLSTFKEKFLLNKKVYLNSQQSQLNKENAVVAFNKQYSSQLDYGTHRMQLQLNGIPLKSEPAPSDWSKIPDKKIDEPAWNPVNKEKPDAAGAIILEPDGRVWIYEPKNHFGGYEHTFSKGRVEPGLTMQQTAIKEAFEETGLQVEITGFLMDQERSVTNTRFYLAKRVGGDPSQAEWEADNVKLVPLDKLRPFLNAEVDRKIGKQIEAKNLFNKPITTAGHEELLKINFAYYGPSIELREVNNILKEQPDGTFLLFKRMDGSHAATVKKDGSLKTIYGKNPEEIYKNNSGDLLYPVGHFGELSFSKSKEMLAGQKPLSYHIFTQGEFIRIGYVDALNKTKYLSFKPFLQPTGNVVYLSLTNGKAYADIGEVLDDFPLLRRPLSLKDIKDKNSEDESVHSSNKWDIASFELESSPFESTKLELSAFGSVPEQDFDFFSPSQETSIFDSLQPFEEISIEKELENQAVKEKDQAAEEQGLSSDFEEELAQPEVLSYITPDQLIKAKINEAYVDVITYSQAHEMLSFDGTPDGCYIIIPESYSGVNTLLFKENGQVYVTYYNAIEKKIKNTNDEQSFFSLEELFANPKFAKKLKEPLIHYSQSMVEKVEQDMVFGEINETKSSIQGIDTTKETFADPSINEKMNQATVKGVAQLQAIMMLEKDEFPDGAYLVIINADDDKSLLVKDQDKITEYYYDKLVDKFVNDNDGRTYSSLEDIFTDPDMADKLSVPIAKIISEQIDTAYLEGLTFDQASHILKSDITPNGTYIVVSNNFNGKDLLFKMNDDVYTIFYGGATYEYDDGFSILFFRSLEEVFFFQEIAENLKEPVSDISVLNTYVEPQTPVAPTSIFSIPIKSASIKATLDTSTSINQKFSFK